MTFTVEVIVALKPVVNDPQGLVVRDGLRRLGFSGVRAVRVGKHIELEVEADDETGALARASALADRLLANPVMEDALV